MKTSNSFLALLIFSGGLSLIGMILNFFLFLSDIINVVLGNSGIFAGIGYLLFLAFLVTSLIFFVRKWKEHPSSYSLFILLGMLSLFSLAIDKVMFDEIARQYQAGMSISELNILLISAAFKIITIAGYLFALFKYNRSVIRI